MHESGYLDQTAVWRRRFLSHDKNKLINPYWTGLASIISHQSSLASIAAITGTEKNRIQVIGNELTRIFHKFA
jgi:hypothetical protein